ncbi:Uncharacterised protein [Bordetella pertussis]|nr:Uncharacterised protein [Bordetella pertussis]
MADADVADAAGGLPFAQHRQVGAPVEQVVDLHEVDALAAQLAQRRLHLRQAGGAAAGPHLGGDKGALAQAGFGQQPAGDGLGASVHRGAVQYRAAGGEQGPHDLAEGVVLGRGPGDVETDVGSAADHGQRGAVGRDRPRQQTGRGRHARGGQAEGSRAGQAQEARPAHGQVLGRAGRGTYFTSVIGTSARWITLRATDPSSRPPTAPRPRVPMTIRSHCFSLA